MADKTVSTQPSTLFHGPSTSSSDLHIYSQLTSASPSSSIHDKTRHTSAPMTMPHRTIDIAMLLSPPEAAPIDNFNTQLVQSTMGRESKLPFAVHEKHLPLSPPISPATKALAGHEPASTTTNRDPILYPQPDNTGASASLPLLFDERATASQLVRKHLAEREPHLFRDASPPRQNEYELALEFKSHIWQTFEKSNRMRYLRRERAQLLEDQAVRTGISRKYPMLAPARGSRSSDKRKLSSATKPKPHKIPKLPRPVPDLGTKRVAREDKDFELLPDHSPPTSSLPSRYNSLKVDWRGAPIDLTLDPHRHLLHEDELLLAANLRLDCATYLTSKRRIFRARIEALRVKKEFRKTDAQQACKIDVNKASKLWQAYDKVGWLHPKWVEKYL